MILEKATPLGATVYLTASELVLVNNALNEVCNGIHIDVEEFHTRLGSSRAEAEQLLAAINKVVDLFPKEAF